MAATGLRDPADAESNMAKTVSIRVGSVAHRDAEQYPDGASMLDLVRRGILGVTRTSSGLSGVDSAAVAEQLSSSSRFRFHRPTPRWLFCVATCRTVRPGSRSRLGVSSGILIFWWGIPANHWGLNSSRSVPRGFIDEPRLRREFSSQYQNEWIDVAEKLRYSPMTVSDAVNAVVQNHLDSSQGAAIAQQNGLEPGAFDILQQTAGEHWRGPRWSNCIIGVSDRSGVKQALAESRLKNNMLTSFPAPHSPDTHG